VQDDPVPSDVRIASPRNEEHPEQLTEAILQRLISVERERIESANRRTEVTRLAIEKNDAADLRQYQYQLARLHSEEENGRRKFQLVSRLLIGVGSFAGLVIIFLFGMAFFGQEEQREMALSILIVLAIAVGGYGVIGGVVAGVRRMIGN
jgi:hypothetical protein